MLVEFHKMLVKIAGKTMSRLILKKQSDLGLHCLSRPFQQAISVQNFSTFIILISYKIPVFDVVVIPAFFFRKKGYINFVSKSVRRPSVRPSVRPSLRTSVRHVSCKCISS